jgi:DNA primase
MFDAIEFCIDHNIEYWTEGENVARGWTNVQCPFCDDHNNHGGINPIQSYYNCWRCGWHSLESAISELLNVSFSEAVKIKKEYTTNILKHNLKKKKEIKHKTIVSLPEGTGELKKQHRDYLVKRNFDPDEIIEKWNIKGTSHLGSFMWRLIIPIYFKGQLVSYTSRDITDKQDIRYKTALPENEVVFHKNIVYGLNKPENKGIIVEGPFDVWRMKKNTVCTFGTMFSLHQIKCIAENFNEVFILFDPDAIDKGKYLAQELSMIGCKAHVVSHDLDCDPGDLSQNDADYLRKKLIGF